MKDKLKEIFIKYHILYYFLLAAAVYLITECFSRRSVFRGIGYLFTHPLIFLLNVIIVFWTYSLVMLTRRKKFTTILISALWIVIGIVDFILRSYRVTPFNASDFTLIKSAIDIAFVYMGWWQIALIIIGILSFVAAIIYLYFKLPKSTVKVRVVVSIAMVVVTFFSVNGLANGAVNINLLPSKFGNLTEAYAEYGIAYCFSNSLLNMGISRPDNYSEEVVNSIVNDDIIPKETLSLDLIINASETDENPMDSDKSSEIVVEASEQTPNIIFLQLESFFDVSRIKGISFSQDPIPNFHSMQENYISGFLNVPSVGAGTANTEFELITGMNLDFFGAGEYPYNTVLKSTVCESLAFDLKNIGYTASAIHNNDGSFYNRNEVFSQLGFDKFISMEYMKDYDVTPLGWVKDSVLAEEVYKTLNSTDGVDYIYTISVQGHGAYPSEDILGDKKVITISGTEDEEKKNSMEYYANQLYEMDIFIKRLTDMLAAYEEKTVLVLYGDHLPSLGFTEDDLTNQDLFQTEYIIWSNYALNGAEKDLEAYQLSAYVLDLLDIHVGTMVCYHQNSFENTDNRTAEQEQNYLDEMEILEYDILYGEQKVYDGTTPYQATELIYGNYDIYIEDIWLKDSFMYALGGGFNEFSQIFIDDKLVETELVSENVLYVPDADLNIKDTYEVEVYQVCEDRTRLGGSGKVTLKNLKIVDKDSDSY